ncbi:histone-fold-containing protein [Venturia nashicola]|nr:histone-fold-containing protein [Venturia nashicola]
MPPRKSTGNASIASAEDTTNDQSTLSTATTTKAPKESGYGVEDYNLPKTMVQRLSKGVLPPNTQIQKDALLAISKSATVFINYLSSVANEQAQRANKKTIQPKDVMDAIHLCEFDSFLPRLEAELEKYNAVQCDKRNTYRRKVREEQKSAKLVGLGKTGEGVAGAGDGEEPVVTTETNGDGERAAKKLRKENGEAEDVGEEEDAPDEEDVEDEEDEEEEEDVEETFEDAKEQLVEDPLEERVDQEMEDEVLDGEESD